MRLASSKKRPFAFHFIQMLLGNAIGKFKEKAICISLHSNALRKDMNAFLFFPATDKIVRQTGFFSLDKATSLREGKLRIQTWRTQLKHWPCVTSYLWQRGRVNIYFYSHYLFTLWEIRKINWQYNISRAIKLLQLSWRGERL